MNRIIKTDSIFICQIDGYKYACQMLESGKFEVIENNRICDCEENDIFSYSSLIKPIAFYKDDLKEEMSFDEIASFQKEINKDDFVIMHDINNLYFKDTGFVFRYFDVASSKGLFKKVKVNGKIVNIALVDNFNPDYYDFVDDICFISIVPIDEVRPNMSLDEVNTIIKNYELALRYSEEEEEKIEKSTRKRLIKSIFKK